MKKKRVCIIGAGLGGLSLSVRLAKLGLDVTVFEQAKSIGGKINIIDKQGFRFGTGASLLTMPFVIKELFEYADEDIDNYLKFKKLDILCKYFFPDSTIITAYSNRNKFAEEIEAKTKDSSEDVMNYFSYCKKIYDNSGELFLFKSLSEPSTFFNKNAFRSLLNIRTLDTNRSMHEANSSFFKDPKTIQIFDRYATYNGSNPYCTPATLNIIQYVEYFLGGYTCEGGMYEIPMKLKLLAEKLGVKIFKNSSVKKISQSNRLVYGVQVEGKEEEFDIVVSNADVDYTYKELLNDRSSRMAKRYEKLERSSSAIVFYWGINRLFPELEIHNILFSEKYKEEFDKIFNKKHVSSDPTVYIYISSKFNKEDAPDGAENWFVMINAPSNYGQNWDKIIDEARTNIISKISSVLKLNIEQYIIFEDILTPVKIEEATNSSKGSIYGISSNNKMSAFLRQQNKSKHYKGLYFCGGSAHPGGGIPLVTLSAKITADLISKYELKYD
jgi:phytoene desaturase